MDIFDKCEAVEYRCEFLIEANVGIKARGVAGTILELKRPPRAASLNII